MESVLSLLLWGGLFFLMMRFGCGSHMFARGSRQKTESGIDGHGVQGGCCGPGKTERASEAASPQQLRWEAPEQDNDPVCGEIVSPENAKSCIHDGQVYYFCSRECREAFEVLPEQYVGPGEPHNVRRLDHNPDQGERHG